MKSLAALLLLTAALHCTLRAEIPAGWSTDFPGAISAAASARQPVLLFFTASWCGPCKLMAGTTLADPAVEKKINGIEHVAIDIDEHSDLASQYGVNAVPTFIMLSTEADEADRATGYQPAGDFLQWLATSGSEARAVLVRQTLSRKSLAEVDSLLVSTGTDSLHRAALKLFDLCDERDSTILKVAAGRLMAVADHDPAALLEGLDDPRLATRIQVANVLQYKIGGSFDIDPWSDAATREKQIRAWRGQLAKMPDAKASN